MSSGLASYLTEFPVGGYARLGDKRRVIIGSTGMYIKLILKRFLSGTQRLRVALPPTLGTLQSLLVGIGQVHPASRGRSAVDVTAVAGS
jgi:hypothetical protein